MAKQYDFEKRVRDEIDRMVNERVPDCPEMWVYEIVYQLRPDGTIERRELKRFEEMTKPEWEQVAERYRAFSIGYEAIIEELSKKVLERLPRRPNGKAN